MDDDGMSIISKVDVVEIVRVDIESEVDSGRVDLVDGGGLFVGLWQKPRVSCPA